MKYFTNSINNLNQMNLVMDYVVYLLIMFKKFLFYDFMFPVWLDYIFNERLTFHSIVGGLQGGFSFFQIST